MDENSTMEQKFSRAEWRKQYLLVDMTSEDVANWIKQTDVVLLPVGTCEQHGPHLPLGVDTYSAMLLAYAAAERAKIPVAPPVWTGISPFHMGRAGSITVRRETFGCLIYDICRSLIHHGFNKIVVVVGHVTNLPTMVDTAFRIRYETGALVFTYNQGEMLKQAAEKFFGVSRRDTGHAGERETAAMLHWNEELVDMEKAPVGGDLVHPPWLPPELKPSKFFEASFKGHPVGIPLDDKEITALGNAGDPSRATKEMGEKLHGYIIDHLSDFLNTIKAMKVEVTNRVFRERI